MTNPIVPGVDHAGLAAAIHYNTRHITLLSANIAADVALAYNAAHHKCTCEHDELDIEMARSFNEGEEYRKAFARENCDRDHADDVWVEVDIDTWLALQEGTRMRNEWVLGDDDGRYFVHRDDLPDHNEGEN